VIDAREVPLVPAVDRVVDRAEDLDELVREDPESGQSVATGAPLPLQLRLEAVVETPSSGLAVAAGPNGRAGAGAS